MPTIAFENVDLLYPARSYRRPTFKDVVLNGLFRKRIEGPRYLKGLDQVTFRVDGGECVGVIGRNGAGKSTLLRAVADVYPTSAGIREVHGAVTALFDVAAGFEWNATGWENIHLRAYLQGESPATLSEKLDAIADFTELGEMLDAPLKTYSTGRIMLLSFAIAVCCEPDILVIDEFLSTADLHVREKAIARIVAMLRQSRIVLIASHDLAFLRQFCTRVIWLENGQIKEDGPAEWVIDSYIQAENSGHALPSTAAQIV